MKRHLFVFSGPSGVGKGTVLNKALPLLGDITYSVSCTTRDPRPEDIEGKTYHFMTKDDFKRMADEGKFLEWAEVYGHYYGTRKDIVQAALDEGKDVLLEIDVQGALQVKKKMPEAVTIFLQPPSADELAKRLRGRGTESEEELATRIKNSVTELDFAEQYDHFVINDIVDNAVCEFIKIVKGYREEL